MLLRSSLWSWVTGPHTSVSILAPSLALHDLFYCLPSFLLHLQPHIQWLGGGRRHKPYCPGSWTYSEHWIPALFLHGSHVFGDRELCVEDVKWYYIYNSFWYNTPGTQTGATWRKWRSDKSLYKGKGWFGIKTILEQ